MDDLAAAQSSFDRGVEARERGEHATAFACFRSAVASWDRVGYSGALSGCTLVHLSGYHLHAADFVAGLATAERGCAVFDALDEESADIDTVRAACEHYRGTALSYFGRHTEAYSAVHTSMAISDRRGDSERVADALLALATLCRETGELKKGLIFSQRAAALSSSTITPTGGIVARASRCREALRVQGVLLLALMRADEALACIRLLLAAEQRVFGRNSGEAAQTMALLAHGFIVTEQYEHASAMCTETMSILEALGLERTPSYANILSSLSDVAVNVGDLDRALSLLQRCLAIHRTVGTLQNSAAQATIGNIVKLLTSLGRNAEAAALRAEEALLTRRSQTRCAGPGCKLQLRPDGAPLDVCVRCRRTHYCSKACQTADWKRDGGHKAECKALIAEAVAAADTLAAKKH